MINKRIKIKNILNKNKIKTILYNIEKEDNKLYYYKGIVAGSRINKKVRIGKNKYNEIKSSRDSICIGNFNTHNEAIRKYKEICLSRGLAQ